MRQNLVALVSGVLFGLGLGLSQMIDRERVLSFLDVAGAWDATLLFVLGGAVATTVTTFRFVLHLPHPFYDNQFYLPTQKEIDSPLVIGAIIFGIGWGMAGYCPGPAITALILGSWNSVLFLGAMIVGSLTYRWFSSQIEPIQKT
ncbi:MAG TPA: DUF6691 family protein [Allocoleopsis sp.]